MVDVPQYTSPGIFCKGFGGHGVSTASPAPSPGDISYPENPRLFPLRIYYKTFAAGIQSRGRITAPDCSWTKPGRRPSRGLRLRATEVDRPPEAGRQNASAQWQRSSWTRTPNFLPIKRRGLRRVSWVRPTQESHLPWENPCIRGPRRFPGQSSESGRDRRPAAVLAPGPRG
jgi:hypothetical protein